MKVGVLAFLTEYSGNPGAIAREAEKIGFESFWVAEHLVLPASYATYYPRSSDGKVPEFYGYLIDPFVALAMAATTTSKIKLGTGICLLPERNVIETAKAAASIDHFSNGRLILGVGAGWFPEEARIMGVDFTKRWKHLRESVEALRVLWTKDVASYEGEIIKFPPVKLGPKPAQKPAPPILIGAHDPKYALKRVARYGDGWCPGGLSPEKARECIPQIKKMAKEEYGRDPEKLEFGVLVMGAAPTAVTLKRYREAGISRVVMAAAGSAHGDGIKAIRELESVVASAADL
ncbi:MAG TPA: TIGR03619 family F420-dependent LLM class oxidoreductase [Candidatus Binataceae bacterium]|nr:TIGR03619 family F420-dependent LLM class oxidoreductase [Candidatus Binataceae bacterium]